MEIITVILVFVVFICGLLGMANCNYLDRVLQFSAHYKNIARAITITQLAFMIIGVCVETLLGYVITINFELWNQ